MSNTILTPTAVTREALRILHQKLTFVGNINRQYDDSFANSGAKIGDSLKIRLPNQYKVRTGASLSTGTDLDTTESSVTLQIATQKGVDVSFSSAELTLSLDDFSKRILEPAMAVLAANIESDAFSMINNVYNAVDNDTAAITFAKLMAGRKALNDSLAPMNDRTAILNTQDNVDLVDALKGLFHDGNAVKQQYRDGMMGRTAGFDFYESTLIPSATTGTAAKTTGYATNDATAQTGAELTVDTGSTTFKAGDIITIAGVYSVHPETKLSTGVLQKFVVAPVLSTGYCGNGSGASATTTGTSTTKIGISPSIVASGPTQNVSNGAANDQAIVKVGAGASEVYYPSLVFQKDAFAFATADLMMPKGVDFAAREVYDGISMRIVRQYAISTDTFPCRIDVMYGYKTLRPQLACRILSN
jgi:hypothetical protein